MRSWRVILAIVPKLIGVLFLGGIGIAFAADPTSQGSTDLIGELWTMAKAAGILGTAVLGFLLHRELKRGDVERAELRRLQEERDAMHERSLTALININKTIEDQTKVTGQMVESNRSLIDWLKDWDRNRSKR